MSKTASIRTLKQATEKAVEDKTQIAELTKRIEHSEAQFRALIEKSSDAVALVTAQGDALYASPATYRLVGYTPEEFIKLRNPFKLVPPDDRKFVTMLFEKLLTKPGTTEHAIYRVTHKNGQQIWIESQMTNLLDDPNVNAIVINYRDISERKMLETQKEDFISIATHELKTPVTSIKGYSQVLQNRFGKAGNLGAVAMLSKMNVQISKLTNLIGDLLDVRRVDEGILQLHKGRFDFNSLVSDIVEEMQITTTKHHIAAKLGGTKIITGDRDRLGQVLTNLISNAIRYSPHQKEIAVSTTSNVKGVTVCVQDFGIGIPKEKQKRVFDRFFRAGESEDTYAGLGLGLFISSEIVDRHGGRMWVESEEGEGSKFYFNLPIRQPEDDKRLSLASARPYGVHG